MKIEYTLENPIGRLTLVSEGGVDSETLERLARRCKEIAGIGRKSSTGEILHVSVFVHPLSDSE